MNKSAVLLVTLAALCLAQLSLATRVTILGARIDSYSPISGSSLNVWVSQVGSSIPITPFEENNTTLSFELTEGETYTFHTNQPSFYHYAENMLISGSVGLFYNAPLVPVTSGVTVMQMWDPTNKHTFSYANVSFPAGQFAFESFSRYAGGSYTAFGNGVPPAQFENLYFAMRFTNLAAGTYRLYSEARNLQVQTNFTSGKARYGIFAGNNPATGLKGLVESASREEVNWYAGNIIVTNPSSGCYNYQWSTVDTYSAQYGPFDLSAPGSTPVALTEDCFDLSSPSALECVDMIYNDTKPTRTCGAFGDPHIIKFDSVGVTCSNLTSMTLVDNEYFSITATARFISATDIATVFSSITFTYKVPCNPISVTWTESAVNPAISNAPLAYRHRLYLLGRNMYTIDALHMRFQVRKSAPGGITFGLSIPTDLIEMSAGICTDSCPGFEQDISTKKRAITNVKSAKLAAAACDGLTGFQYDACMFDVEVTGKTEFAAVVAEFNTMDQELAEAWTTPAAPPDWPAPTPDTLPEPITVSPPPTDAPSGSNPPSGTPIDGTNPTGNMPSGSAPTSSSAVIVPSILVLIASVASLLL